MTASTLRLFGERGTVYRIMAFEGPCGRGASRTFRHVERMRFGFADVGSDARPSSLGNYRSPPPHAARPAHGHFRLGFQGDQIMTGSTPLTPAAELAAKNRTRYPN